MKVEFIGTGIAWDAVKNKVLCNFNDCNGIYQTSDAAEIGTLMQMGYQHRNILSLKQQAEVLKKAIEEEEKNKEVEKEEITGDELDIKTQFVATDLTDRDQVINLLDKAGVPYKKNMKTESLAKLLTEAIK